ncbi:MAG: hypothetical protein LUH22_12600 [Bacteroides sp.]|nr:hypothetical protein [Bacteroides sp.]
MNTNFKLIALFICIIISSIISAQNCNYSIELLKNKKWVVQGIEEKDFSTTCKYDDSNLITIFKYEGKEYTIVDPYYLSENQDTEFDESKVNTVNHGTFIIQKSATDVFVFQIVHLSESTMSLKNMSSNVVVNYAVEADQS